MKKKGEPCPDHRTLRLGRVGWPFPPTSYKYRERTRKQRGGKKGEDNEDFWGKNKNREGEF
jgi:hypothetical protein